MIIVYVIKECTKLNVLISCRLQMKPKQPEIIAVTKTLFKSEISIFTLFSPVYS